MKRKTTMQKSRLPLILLPFTFYLLPLISGCATAIEGTKGFLGISTKSLEEGRKAAIVKNFNFDYSTCYTKTKDILKQIKAYIYAQDINKRMIAIYVTNTDTTAVGVFFKEIDANNTQIEVSSASKYAKEIIAERLFAILAGLPDPVKEPVAEENTQKGIM
jgi:hypothetical protein